MHDLLSFAVTLSLKVQQLTACLHLHTQNFDSFVKAYIAEPNIFHNSGYSSLLRYQFANCLITNEEAQKVFTAYKSDKNPIEDTDKQKKERLRLELLLLHNNPILGAQTILTRLYEEFVGNGLCVTATPATTELLQNNLGVRDLEQALQQSLKTLIPAATISTEAFAQSDKNNSQK